MSILPRPSSALPTPKTGAKVTRLGKAAIDVLAAIECQPGSPHVIAGTLLLRPLRDGASPSGRSPHSRLPQVWENA